MRSKRLIWRIYFSYLLLILGALSVVSFYISASVRDLYLERTQKELRARVFVMSDQVLSALISSPPKTVDSLCDALGGPTETRITVVLKSGKVIADTHEDPAVMNNHADRPEIISAFNGTTGSSVRYSHTLGEEMMYVASPLYIDDTLAACLRAAVPLTAIDQTLAVIHRKTILGSIGVAFLAALIGLWVAGRLTKPLEALRKGVDQFARGNFQAKVRAGGSFEVEELSLAINHMAESLDNKITEIIDQKAERDAILGSMVEGVIAVDNSEILLSINDAAARWFQVESESAVGKTLSETVRNPGLLRFISDTLSSTKVTESEFSHSGAKELVLQARGARLRNARQVAVGAVIVMSDITRLKKLDQMRRDFVANVSHELKTPITSIMGFVETLRTDGAVSAEEKDRFLGIIANQSERLNTIIDDLLTLSRLEQGGRLDESSCQLEILKTVIEASVSLCSHKAEKSNIKITVDCSEDLIVSIDSQLMEQALVNLIDNAIKYSDTGSIVEITCKLDEIERVVVCVADHGAGIEARHLPRLFERFYRADKARSREEGGTGLGLAIVKHIVQSHGGQTLVSSEPGKGSSFFIVLNSFR